MTRTAKIAACTVALLLAFGALAVVLDVTPADAQSYISSLRRPKIVNGPLTFPNAEQVDNDTNGSVEWQGVGGADDTDLALDLDGTRPVLSSPTDTAIEIAESVLVTGALIDLDPTGAVTLDVDAAATVTLTMADNVADALDVQVGTDNYLTIVTTDANERIQMGNTTTNQRVEILGSGGVMLPKTVAAAVVEPAVCAAGTAGLVVYVDDTNDTAAAQVCVCMEDTNDATFDWVNLVGGADCTLI